MLQISIVRLDGSLMAINRTSEWEVLRALCLMEMTRLVEVPCLRKYHVLWKSKAWKKYFHE